MRAPAALRPLAALVVAGLVASCGGDINPSRDGSAGQRNVILITVDTTRADRLGCYGGAAGVTPRLDELAERGVLFDRAYCPVPFTLPSHTTLMTGEQPFVHGVRSNAIYRVPEAAHTLAEHLRDAGWATAAFPAAEVLNANYGIDQGFDHYDDELPSEDGQLHAMRPAADTFARLESWLDRSSDERTGKPLFLWLHYFEPHFPYDVAPGLEGKFSTAYEAELHFTDMAIDQALTALHDRGMLEDAWVCVTADHGEALGDHAEPSHGMFVYEETMRVPLVLHHPNVTANRIGTLVGLADVPRTLAALAGAPAFPCSGRDLSALIAASSPTDIEEAPVYLETYVPHVLFGWSPAEALVSDTWKYIAAPEPELYHLADDPSELDNRIERDADHARRMRERLLAYREQRAGALSSESVSVDAATAQRMAALGYATAGGSEFTGHQLPAPGPDAGPDPKQRTDLLPAVYELMTEISRDPNSPKVGRLVEYILARDPGNALALQTKAVALVVHGQYRAAIPLLRRLIDAGRATAKTTLSLGTALLNTDAIDEAAEMLQRCLDLDPINARALRWLGQAEQRRGNTEAAIQLYQRILALDDVPPEAKQQIRELVQSLR